MGRTFWIGQGLIFFGLGLVAYLSGLLVRHRNVRVNYTRKVNFFALFLIPMSVNYLMPFQGSATTRALRTVFFILVLALFVRPVRERVRWVGTMFLSYDRPEDRPYTLLWLTTQLIAGMLVVAPLTLYFARLGLAELMFIPIFIHILGDGFAEPIGVRFGRHRYRVRAMFSDRTYTRSLEGSAWIFLVGAVIVAAFRANFTNAQFAPALLLVPLTMSLAEALSPHTWDTPFLFLAGGLSLLAIVRFL